LLADPWFYLVSVPAVLVFGIVKGGFGGSIAIMAVPLMALVMPPTQAAAILLPILVLMDVLVVKTYWGLFDRRALYLLIPGAVAGVALGYITAGAMNEHYMRILVGVLSLVFGLQSLVGLQGFTGRAHHGGSGSFFGALAGFTSFSIHAGGPPFTMYLSPKQLSPVLFAGTAGLFFAAVNAMKLVPYYALGQFDTDNLSCSLVLAPLAPLGVKVGHHLVRRSTPSFYYTVVNVALVLVGAKLLWDGVTALGWV
jgi:uncharacterized membrane protein YfcA